jgi:AcrR family transcriptional regulator
VAVRARILEAAERLFSQYGFRGAALRDIARDADVSLGLLQYHFGAKEALYAAVKRSAMERYEGSQRSERAPSALPIEEEFRESLVQFSRFFDAHPDLERMVMWAHLEGDHRAWPNEIAMMEEYVGKLREAQKAGLLRADLDPHLFIIATSAVMRAWPIYKQRYETELAHLGDDPGERRDAFARHAASMLMAGALARPETKP